MRSAASGFLTALAALARARVDFILVGVGVRAKELAGRPKDVEFLRLYAARLREQMGG